MLLCKKKKKSPIYLYIFTYLSMIRGGNKNGVGKDYELCFFKALCCIISFSKDSFVVDVAVVAIVFCIVEEKFHRII